MGHWLILGGTGFVGRALARRLAAGQDERRLLVPTRHRAHAQALAVLPQLDVVEADLHDDAALAGLVAGADAVVNLVAVLHGSEARFEQVHVALPRRLAAACAAAGVRRVVHVSALGAAPDAPSRYLRSKARGEAVLRAAGLGLTVLRPSVIFGAEDRLLNLFARLQRFAPVLPLAGATARFQPVWVEDVAAALARCLADPATIGQTYECTGPAVMTLAELVRAAGRCSGHERPVVALPPALATLQAWAMECLPGEPLVSRDNLASMQVPSVATPGVPGIAALGIAATPLATVAPAYLGRDAWQTGLDEQRARHR
ncbi:MAG: complex I NDUFA9 subunit family protein [Burkholderiaceae bacterium]